MTGAFAVVGLAKKSGAGEQAAAPARAARFSLRLALTLDLAALIMHIDAYEDDAER